jgi:hypothetical protein
MTVRLSGGLKFPLLDYVGDHRAKVQWMLGGSPASKT